MMENTNWQRVAQIFARALDEPTGGRDAFLDQHCGDNAELRKVILSLLVADGEADSLLDGGAANQVTLADLALAENQRIGPYRVIRAIGAGGMGTVYLARREDGEFDQTVALKLVNPGHNSAELARRLRAERQILAKLEHPAIARLIDGGVTDDGRPYFTMEYVDGTPIDEYCDRNQLSVGARLKLFAQVLHAVAYAQQSLVVHRDLKPSNILVSSAGEVKLLDFGIAKVLAEGGQNVNATRTVMRAMTPQYAAPEQVRGEPVTTATDVYALGLILYSLLSGNRPYLLTRGTPEELERLVCQEMPPTMSRAVDDDDERVRVRFGVAGGRLRRRLAGDLDTICAKAMRKEPGRRYLSAQQMLDDLERHRAGFPVRARPDTFWYRTRKFARRNQGPLIVALVAVLAIVGLLGFYTARLADERDRAHREARKSVAISEFLSSLLKNADPGQTRGAKLTVREVLDASAERIDDELIDQPYVRASILDVIGMVYAQLGQLEDAERILTEALRVREELYDHHVDLATSLHNLAEVHNQRGQVHQAQPLLQRALAMRQALLGEDTPEVATTLGELAYTQFRLSDLDAAEAMFRRAIALANRVEGADPTIALNSLAIVLHARHDYEASARMYGEVLTQLRARSDTDLARIGSTLHNLAQVMMDQNKLEEAEAMAREALLINRQIYGQGPHPKEVVRLLGLGRILLQEYQVEEAERVLREAHALSERIQGERHPYNATATFELGSVALVRGDYRTAERLFDVATRAFAALHGAEHRNVFFWAQYRAQALRGLGQYREALAVQRDGLAAIALDSGATHRRAITAASELARTLAKLGQLDEALAMQEQTAARERESWGDGHRYHLIELGRLADLMRQGQRYREAEALLRRVVEELPRHYGDKHPYLANAVHYLARTRHDQGVYAEAESLYSRAIAIRRQPALARHPDLAASLIGLAEVRSQLGDRAAAVSLVREGIGILEAALPSEHRDLRGARQILERLSLAEDGDVSAHSSAHSPRNARTSASTPKSSGPTSRKRR